MSDASYWQKMYAILEEKQSGDGTLTEEAVLYSFEALNQTDWMQLLYALALNTQVLVSLFSVRPGEDILSYCSPFFRRLPSITRRQISIALDHILVEALQEDNANHKKIIKTAIILTQLMGEGIDINILKDIVRNNALEWDIRKTAADTLASSYDVPRAFWLELDVNRLPFLLPAIVSAIGKISPIDALNQLSHIDDSAFNPIIPGFELEYAIEYPIHMLIEELLRTYRYRKLPEHFQEKFKHLSPHLQSLICVNPLYHELKQLLENNTQSPSRLRIIKFQESRWRSYAERSFAERQCKIYYTGYLQGKIFNRNVEPMPDVFARFVQAVCEEIRITIETVERIAITPYILPLYDFRAMIDNVRKGNAILAEIGYGTDKRGEYFDIIKIGYINKLYAIIPQQLIRTWEIYFGTDEIDNSRLTISLEQVIDFCLLHKIKWLRQSDSSIADTIGDWIDNNLEKLRYYPRNLLGGDIDDPSTIATEIYRTNNSIALLDSITALSLPNEENRHYNLYKVMYNSPLPSGFFIPKMDVEFRRHIYKAILNSIFVENRWDSEFESLMRKAEIDLQDAPSVIAYHEDDGWIEEDQTAA